MKVFRFLHYGLAVVLIWWDRRCSGADYYRVPITVPWGRRRSVADVNRDFSADSRKN